MWIVWGGDGEKDNGDGVEMGTAYIYTDAVVSSPMFVAKAWTT